VEEHTFVILAYRQSAYLEACIESLLGQTMKSRVIMATATPSAWLSGIGDRYGIPIFVRQGAHQMADDWNFALSAGGAGLVTLAHQDDLYHQTYTERILQAAGKYPDTLIIFTDNALMIDGRRVDRTLNLTIQRMLLWPFCLKQHIRSQWVRRLTLSFGNPICCPSVTYYKRNLDQNGPVFQFDRSYPNNLDWEAWIRLARQKGAFVYVRERLMTHRFHQDSETSASLAGERRRVDDRRIFNLLWPRPVAAVISRLYALAYRSKHD